MSRRTTGIPRAAPSWCPILLVTLACWCPDQLSAAPSGEPPSGRATLRAQTAPNGAPGDGVYGRFDGDFDFGVGLGALVLPSTPQDDATWPGVRLSSHYFSTLGLWVQGFTAPRARSATRLSLGVELQPLFLPRWALNLEQGPATLDLFLDSFALGLGVSTASQRTETGQEPTTLDASVGIGIPMLGCASGPWLELRAAHGWALASASDEVAVTLFLTWHELWTSPWLAPTLD